MNIVFMGTPDFAVTCLEKLMTDGHNIKAVFCQPDKPKGRGHKLLPPPVKEFAIEQKLRILQPITLKSPEIIQELEQLSPELIVVVAYGKILPIQILEIPKHGCINIHASLLPKYRGAAPIQWAIFNGEKITGITSMLMNEGLDTGDILLQRSTEISETETTGELFERLSILGADVMAETIEYIINGTLQRTPQNDSESSCTTTITKDFCMVDLNENSKRIYDKIRGLSPSPTARIIYKNKILKIHNARIANVDEIGTKGKIILKCGDNTAIEFLEVQLESSKRMKASDFLNGHGGKFEL